METLTSKDGTRIAYERAGDGPPLILVDGALSSRSGSLNTPLAALLAPQFTVYTYDRRGRGDSGDNPPYAVEREIEDIDALIDAAGGSASVFGISSGAILALDAAARHPTKVRKLAVYEPPFIVDDSRAPVTPDSLGRLAGHVSAGRRGDAVKLFLTEGTEVPGFVVTLMSFFPMWKRLKALAHTLPYDAICMAGTQSGSPLRVDRWASLTSPALVVDGGKSPVWMRNGVRALVDLLPDAQRVTLEGQTHVVKPAVLAPVLADFFAAQAGPKA
jgi:pimeloyl-ACP methyl ester carboxylesterase